MNLGYTDVEAVEVKRGRLDQNILCMYEYETKYYYS